VTGRVKGFASRGEKHRTFNIQRRTSNFGVAGGSGAQVVSTRSTSANPKPVEVCAFIRQSGPLRLGTSRGPFHLGGAARNKECGIEVRASSRRLLRQFRDWGM